jgi:diguanylate cyclase (GGDEF)-like protein
VQWGEEARHRAITDELTGLYNRRYLDETLEHLVSAAQHDASELSLVMIDLDHFSSINEIYSQSVGDEVLSHVVEVFRQSLRDEDVAARYGGDEFNIILPSTGREAALEICSTIRQRVEALDVLHDRGGTIDRVTTSQGIATLPENASDTQGLREAADAALYAAKEAGRNRVCHTTTVRTEGA